MNIAPIQISDIGILIPRQYLPSVEAFELVLSDEYILIRPKSDSSLAAPIQSPLHFLIGIAETKGLTASERTEEILVAELDSQSGWTHVK